MNPTQNPDNTAPETQPDTNGSATWLASLLLDGSRFGDHIASMTKAAAKSPASGSEPEPDGYVLTEAGHRYLDEKAFAELCEKHAADEADSYGERLIEAYVAHHEAADAREMAEQGDEPGSVPEVLRNAAVYLERHGWIQGAYYDATSGGFLPPACVVGAIGMVCYGGPVDAPAQMFDHEGFAEFEQALLHLDRYLLVENGTEAYAFNDARGRTVDDVTHALRQAAATPEHELVDALKAIDDANDWLTESGLTTEQVAALLKGNEAVCTCTFMSDTACAHCTSAQKASAKPNFTDCLLCGAPGGYPYCTGNHGGQLSCADVVREDGAEGGDAR